MYVHIIYDVQYVASVSLDTGTVLQKTPNATEFHSTFAVSRFSQFFKISTVGNSNCVCEVSSGSHQIVDSTTFNIGKSHLLADFWNLRDVIY